jgi:hypothetical protein
MSARVYTPYHSLSGSDLSQTETQVIAQIPFLDLHKGSDAGRRYSSIKEHLGRLTGDTGALGRRVVCPPDEHDSRRNGSFEALNEQQPPSCLSEN